MTTVCCAHNPCPQRPTWFLGRFLDRPWRCPQCGKFWVTFSVYSWAEFDHYSWKRVDVK